MDRTQLWGRRLLSGGFVALAVLGVRYVGAGTADELLGAGPVATRREHCLVRDLAVTYAVEQREGVDGFAVTGARLDGPDACVGSTLSITFTGPDGTTLGRATGTFDRSSPSLALDSGGTIAVDDVATLAVVLFD